MFYNKLEIMINNNFNKLLIMKIKFKFILALKHKCTFRYRLLYRLYDQLAIKNKILKKIEKY